MLIYFYCIKKVLILDFLIVTILYSLSEVNEVDGGDTSLSENISKKKENKLLDKLVRGKSASSTSVNSTNSQDSLNFDDSLAEVASLTKSHSNLEISTMTEADFINSSVQETRSLCDMDNLTIRISPEKVINLPSLTEAQVKAITGNCS